MNAYFLFICVLIELVPGVLAQLSARARSRGYKLCSAFGYELLQAKFGKEEHFLCLKLKDIGSSPLTSHKAVLMLDPEAEEGYNTIQAFPLADVTMAYGFPVEDPASGSAEGYIGDDNQFYGVLHLGNRTLHADPYGTDDPGRLFGAFENADMAAPLRLRRHNAQMSSAYDSNLHYRIENRKPVAGVARTRICDLLLLADGEFFQKDANASLNHVVRRMVHAVAQADIIFRNTDFNEDGVPDNIGFSVKYIVVLTSNETNTRVFGDLLNERTVDGRQYLMQFARLRRLSEVCLGVAFTGHSFHNRTLGLSFTSLGAGLGGAAGGLCDRRAYGRSFNTLALAHAAAEDEARIPERIAALTLAHEIGHSFGAHHDDNFPNPECRGYLMGAQSSAADAGTHYEFSLCSKRLIAAALHSMSYCLVEEDAPYCGNGIVEEGEACDCGMPSHCSQRDPCCTPRAGGALLYEDGTLVDSTLHKEGCAVAPSAICHPSQGLCCTADCKLKDLSDSGIDCSTQEHECTCTDPSSCRCGLGGRCLEDGSCHAAECATLGLRECQCYKTGTGGTLGQAMLCGVCCQIDAGDGRGSRCVGAEFAAKAVLANRSRLPEDWPDKDYIGRDYCKDALVRAWRVGDACVTRNTVGMCSASGACKPSYKPPRSNVYPDVMHIQLKSRMMSSSSTLKATILNLIVSVLIYIVKNDY